MVCRTVLRIALRLVLLGREPIASIRVRGSVLRHTAQMTLKGLVAPVRIHDCSGRN